MTRREAWLTAAAVFAVALAVRAIAASIVDFPRPEDTAYYVGVARNLVEGRGLVSDSLWSYATPPLVFPRPAFEVWLPLPTFLAAIPMAIAGTTYAAAQVASVLVGAVVPVLAWRVAADVARERALPPGRARTLAIGSGIAAAVYLPLVLHSTLPDSTMPFAALALGACLVMVRLVPTPTNRGLAALGILIGVAALTRNEAAWIGAAWAILAWTAIPADRAGRARAIAIPAAVALAIYAPWAIRDWAVFGSPFPGQAVANALSVTGSDIFAWRDPPTLDRYLAQGPGALIGARVAGLTHNLLNVLLYLGIPTAAVGLLAAPWQLRTRALRPLIVLTLLLFFATSLLFPVATTWGTFLHAAGPAHVLLVISALLGLDALIAAAGRFRGWTRPVAWLGPTLAIAGSVLFTMTFLPTWGADSAGTRRQYEALARSMVAAGRPLDASLGPVISDHPIWLAEEARVPSLALPNESPASILDLAAAFPGTRTMVVHGDVVSDWPAVLDTAAPGTECFTEIDVRGPTDPASRAALGGIRVFAIGCP